MSPIKAPDFSILASKGYVFPLYEHPNFTVLGELKDERTILLHCSDVTKWGIGVYKDMLALMRDIRTSLKGKSIDVVYVLVPASDHKLIKFETMLGFDPVESYHGTGGEVFLLMGQETE